MSTLPLMMRGACLVPLLACSSSPADLARSRVKLGAYVYPHDIVAGHEPSAVLRVSTITGDSLGDDVVATFGGLAMTPSDSTDTTLHFALPLTGVTLTSSTITVSDASGSLSARYADGDLEPPHLTLGALAYGIPSQATWLPSHDLDGLGVANVVFQVGARAWVSTATNAGATITFTPPAADADIVGNGELVVYLDFSSEISRLAISCDAATCSLGAYWTISTPATM